MNQNHQREQWRRKCEKRSAGAFIDSQRALTLQALPCGGWIAGGPKGAAVRLGLKLPTLLSKMKKLGITRPGAGDADRAGPDFRTGPAVSLTAARSISTVGIATRATRRLRFATVSTCARRILPIKRGFSRAKAEFSILACCVQSAAAR